MTTVAAAISGELLTIWAFDNASQSFRGFSPIPGAPNDFVSTAQPVFICITTVGTIGRPVLCLTTI